MKKYIKLYLLNNLKVSIVTFGHHLIIRRLISNSGNVCGE